MLICKNTTYCQTVSCILIWELGRFSLGNLAKNRSASWRVGFLLFKQFHKLTFRGLGKEVVEMSEHPLQRRFWGTWATANVFAIEPLRCG